ncbi:MAG: tetratricopeptide repeat protein [Candidatus Hydrogenedens sp.]|nr:tetratricopeptide repeat protein [Candidatus Hydrogenedens sp.]
MRIILAVGLAAAAAVTALAATQDVARLNDLGIAAYDQKDYATAVENFRAAYARSGSSKTLERNLTNALQALANEQAESSNYDAAITNLEQAISIAPDNVAPFVQLGACFLRQNRVSDAIFRLEEAIEIEPGNLDAHELLGKAYYEDNDLPSARAQWDYVLQVDPSRTKLQELYEKAFREESVEWDFQRKSTRNFSLSYPGEVPYDVRNRLVRILETAYREVGTQFGRVYPPDPVQVIFYGPDQFAQATQMDGHVGALYDGKIRSPLTDERGSYLDEEEMRRRLTHEYVHVIVRQLAGGNVPWWINEGLAETLSSQLTDADRAEVAKAYAEGHTYPLSQLEGDLLREFDAKQLRYAYRQAHVTIAYLWQRYGRTRLQGLMADLARGVPPQEAIRNSYHISYEQLERAVQQQFGR